MGKTWTLFWLVLLSNSFAHSQNNKELLLKAFTSSDSSDYYFKKAKSAIQNKADEAEYYFCKNARHTDYGQADSAIYYGEIALRKMKGIKEENKQLYVYNNLAKVLQREGKYKEAIQNLLHGATIATKQNNSLGLGYCYQNISLNYHDFGDYKRGIYYGKLALERFKMAKPVNVMNDIYALNAIAINFDDWNQPDNALYYHKKILEFKKEIDTSQIGFTYNNIGNTLVKQKKYKEAKTWIETAIKISFSGKFQGVYGIYFYIIHRIEFKVISIYMACSSFIFIQLCIAYLSLRISTVVVLIQLLASFTVSVYIPAVKPENTLLD